MPTPRPHFELHRGWTVWPWGCLRGAGFPGHAVLQAGACAAAAEADRYLWEALPCVRAASGQALNELRNDLDTIDRRQRRRAQKLLKRLENQLAAPTDLDWASSSLVDALGRLNEAHEQAERQDRQWRQQLASEHVRIAEGLRANARSSRFREAVLWQNAAVLPMGIDPFVNSPGRTDSKSRQRERLVAQYLQRYSTKNDTIGFFGPLGWVDCKSGDFLMSSHPEVNTLGSRRVYFEYWAVNAMAERIAEDRRVWPDLVPRRSPSIRIEGTCLHHPIESTLELEPVVSEVLRACDGNRSAREIAAHVRGMELLPGKAEEEVYEVLEDLASESLITWTLEIPTGVTNPAAELQRAIDRIEDDQAKRDASQLFDTLDAARQEVADSAGDEARLRAAIETLEHRFTEATMQASTRHRGQTYAGRTLVYEECLRSGKVSLGDEFRARLGPPLALLLISARWYTYAIACRYRVALTRVYADLARETGQSAVDYARFWPKARALFPGTSSPDRVSIVSGVQAELQAKWNSIIGVDQATPGPIQRSAADLLPAVEASFAAPHPGWPKARHCSPDVMVATGDAQHHGARAKFVVGEIHTGFNTLTAPWIVKEHPDPEMVEAMLVADIPQVGVGQVWSGEKTRTDYFSILRQDIDFENGMTRSARPRDHVVTPSELYIVEEHGALQVRSRTHDFAFDILVFLEQHLIAESFGAFQWISPATHRPRVTVDDVVIGRESWRLCSEDFAFVHADDRHDRFLGARELKHRLGLPRFVFYKVPEETKPCYLDLDSPIYVETFAQLARKASQVAISEMLPSLDECWLRDGDGYPYTSEFRIAACDPESWAPIPLATAERFQ